MVIGGFHLRDNSQGEIENIIYRLKKLGAHYIGSCHCTGDLARDLFKKEFGTYYKDRPKNRSLIIDERRSYQ